MTVAIEERRKVAGSALRLPVCGFGSAHLGELYGTVDDAAAHNTLEAAWTSGLRYFDTAPWYGRGLSELRVGAFLRRQPRAEFIVSTKVGRTLHRPADPRAFDRSPWVGGLNFAVRFDYSRDGIMRSYEQALQRLGLDTIDALVIHDLDPDYHSGEALGQHLRDLERGGIAALQELKAAGDIKAYGMGINTHEAFDRFASSLDLDFFLVAMPYTLIDHSSLHRGMADCLRREINVVIGSPFASGILATGPGDRASYGYASAPPPIQQKVIAMGEIAAKHGATLTAAALQFPLAHPAVVSVIPGAARPEEVTANIDCLTTAIAPAFWHELRDEGLIAVDAPLPPGNGKAT